MSKKQTTLFSYKSKARKATEDDEEDFISQTPPKKKAPAKKAATKKNTKSTPVSKKRKRDEDEEEEYEEDESAEEEDDEEHEDEEEDEEEAPRARKSAKPSSASTPKRTVGKKKKRDEDAVRYDWLETVRDEKGLTEDHPDYNGNTLFIPASAYSAFTPFEKQYWDIKKKQWDTVIFFKKGKFYELYEKDADIGHKEFDLKLTDRVNMRMVGVPESSFKNWASKFIAKGYKIGRVEQMETPDEAKTRNKNKKAPKGSSEKVVQRELQQILTAGTLIDPDMIVDSSINNYLLCIKEDAIQHRFGICYVDASTGEVNLGYIEDDASGTQLETLIQQIMPKELLVERGGLSKQTELVIKNKNTIMTKRKPGTEFWDNKRVEGHLSMQDYFNGSTPQALADFEDNDLVMCAFGGMTSYLIDLKLDTDVYSLGNFKVYDPNSDTITMLLDGQTLLNLEILQNNRDGEKRGSLLEFLDHCVLGFGRRLFRSWVCHPLRNAEAIRLRQEAVEALENDVDLVERIREAFKTVPDLERMLARIHSEAIVSRDHVSFDPDVNKKKIALLLDTIDGLEQAHRIIGMVGEAIEGDMQSELIKKIYQDSPDIESVIETFKGMFDREEARSTGFIVPADGANEQYDDAKKEKEDCEKKLEEYLENAVKILKISKTKVAYKHMQKNLYQIEVPAATQVPDTWKIKTQTKAVRRYYPNDLLPLIEKSAKAEEKRQSVLRGELRRVYKLFDNYYHDWKKVITQVANLDCMISLSLVGRKSGLEMCKPEFITNAVCLDVEEMVHPCITPADGHFIPNDTKLGVIRNSNGQLENKPRLAVVTGANMGGKSTLLRQNCVAVILAQLGCKVPARSFRLSPVDRIFTRIGANDRIMSGESTFMVELNETSNILRNATCNSLIILDELGRGTSTFDGYGIAYAVTRFLAEETQCRTLFATHYFHLTEELKGNPNVSLYQMLVNATDKVTFLYKFVEGVSPQSYGISVAEKAGIPEDITKNATSVSKNFEELLQISDSSDLPGAANVLTDAQRELFAVLYNGLCDGNVDWDSLQERLSALYRIF